MTAQQSGFQAAIDGAPRTAPEALNEHDAKAWLNGYDARIKQAAETGAEAALDDEC